MLSAHKKEHPNWKLFIDVWTIYYWILVETLCMNRKEPNVCGSPPVQIFNFFFSKMWTGLNSICDDVNRFTPVQTGSNQNWNWTGAETKTQKLKCTVNWPEAAVSNIYLGYFNCLCFSWWKFGKEMFLEEILLWF